MNKICFRTWVEVDRDALHNNVEQFLRLLHKNTIFTAVIKSNAYGHGLSSVAKIISEKKYKSDREVWFAVDSITEAIRLKKDGIKNNVLVLGNTLPTRFYEAAKMDIIISISNFDSLVRLASLKKQPRFFIKIDTGMHRQGFLPEYMNDVVALLQKNQLKPMGLYSHLASAEHPSFSKKQFGVFNNAVALCNTAGMIPLIKSIAASGGILTHPESELDMVRIGMGLYGYFPFSKKTTKEKVLLRPVLTWKTVIGEIKTIPRGSYVGYNLTRRTTRPTMIAILPVGYWHGYDRGLSNRAEVVVREKRAQILGMISMDMTIIDITHINDANVGDEVVLIGTQGKEKIFADELAQLIDTTHYEVLTRINPLIERVVV